MTSTLFFYDLETSGFNPRTARIMQFGGQRTDLDLKPLGRPNNCLIKLTDDVLPDPDAVLVTGITPQQTLRKGLSETEFLKYFYDVVAKPNTIFVGFNNIRFDDEFMRFLHYRNFYDAYEWQWKNGRSRWDLLDSSRMTRALRPDGVKWPVNSQGIQTNNLGDLAILNKLSIAIAHDALSDSLTTIELARLLKKKQPKLYEYLLKMRKKENISKLVKSGEPFIYTSGKYLSEFEKTTIVSVIADHPERQGVLVYDLRINPRQFENMTSRDLASIWHRPIDTEEVVLPIKTLQFNRCPAVAPLSVLDAQSEKRLSLDMKKIIQNSQKLHEIKNWPQNILLALDILNKQQQTRLFKELQIADAKLYDGFFTDQDRRIMETIRQSDPSNLSGLTEKCKDERLKELLPLYKARNYPNQLSSDEKTRWLDYCRQKLLAGKDNQLKSFFERITTLRTEFKLSAQKNHLLNELEDYGQTIKANLN